MSDQWYYQQGGEVRGPVSLPEVQRMLRASVLQPADLVREQNGTRWQSISNVLVRHANTDGSENSSEPGESQTSDAEVEAADQGDTNPAELDVTGVADDEGDHVDDACGRRTDDASAGEMPEQALAELLSQADDIAARHDAETVVSASQISRENGIQQPDEPLAGRRWQHAAGAGAGLRADTGPSVELKHVQPKQPATRAETRRQTSTAELTSLGRDAVLSHRTSTRPDRQQTGRSSRPGLEFAMPDHRLLAAAGLAVLVALAVYLPSLFAKSTADYAEQLFAMRQEFLELRGRNASEAEWTEFSERSEVVLSSLIEELSATAGAGDADARARQALLYAARDFFPDMLENARTQPNGSEEQFEFQLSEALRLVDLKPPEGFDMRESAEAVHAHHHHLDRAGEAAGHDPHNDHAEHTDD